MPVVNGDEYNTVKIKTTVLTYLKDFLLDQEHIFLVFDKRNSTISEQSLLSPKIRDEEEDLELTGDPLKVDLGGDESFGPIDNNVKINLWTADEAKHYPLPITVAQKFINKHHKNGNESKDCLPIFAVCNGTDSLRTVILGSHLTDSCIMTTSVYILENRAMEFENAGLQNMVEDHKKNVGSKTAEIEFLVNMTYCVYGNHLQNSVNAINHSDNYSNVSVSVTSRKCVFWTTQGISNLKMNIQIFVGHKCSSLYDFWQELCFINQLINVLSSPENYSNEDTILSPTPLCESEIFSGITKTLSTTVTKAKAEKEFSLGNLREDTFFDKLWKVLKGCENAKILTNAFQFLFEELTEQRPKIIIRNHDQSNISAIISGVADGNLIISSITFLQALELLIELGIEKMKYDYQAILKHFYSNSEQVIISNWSELYSIDAASMQAGGYRKTRITQNIKNIRIKLENSTRKLNYLAKLHIAAEFLIVIKELVNLTECSFDHLCERVSEQHTNMKSNEDFSDLVSNRLHEFSIQLNAGDTKMVEKLYPMKWTMHMKSLMKPHAKHGVEVITIYHLSQNQVFPTQIYDNCHETSATEENDKQLSYYVAKMVMHKDYYK